MLKKLLPHIIAVVAFVFVTLAYFLPYYQGQSLEQGDVTRWEGLSKEIVDWNKAHPDDPALWTGRVFSGMPAFQISLSYAGNFVNKVVHALGVIFPEASVLLFLSFVGFYVLLLCFGVNPWLSLGGALAYGLSSFILISIEAGHNTKVQAMSLMAPVLGGVVLAYRKSILMGAAVTALALAMAIDANHFQVVYYIALMVGITGIYFLVESILEKRIAHFAKASAALIAVAALAVMPNIGNLWSTQEYAKETIRGGSSELTTKKEATKGGGLDFEYASAWSYGFSDGEMLSLVIPDIKGGGGGNALSDDNAIVQKYGQGASGPQLAGLKQQIASLLYWGNQPFTSGTVYFGAAIVFLFIFGLLIVRSHIKWALLFLTIFSILLAAGHNTPFFKLMFDGLMPFFNKFRTPSMALVIAELTMPLLAILGISEIINGTHTTDEILKKLKIAGGIALGIVLAFGLAGSFMYSYIGVNDAQVAQNNPDLISMLKEERASMLRADSIRSLFFIIAAFALLWFFVQKKLSQTIFLAALCTVFLIDNGVVAKRYLSFDKFSEKVEGGAIRPTQADMDILKDPDPNYRVFNIATNTFNDGTTSNFHKSIGGYHAAKLIRYQDLIENQLSKNNIHVLNMLNAKYAIAENKQTNQPQAQQIPGNCGHAWFVHNIKWAANADEEMAGLTDFEPRETVVIDKRYEKMVTDAAIGNDSAATITLTSYTPNVLTYDYNSATPQLTVFSEVYYADGKGWNAYIDGKAVDHFRCNYVLRGMALPAGKHKIEFKFEPKSVVLGNKIAYAGSFMLFALVLGVLGTAGYKRIKEMQVEVEQEEKAPVAKAAVKAPKKK